MEFSRPEYWSGQPFPSSGDLPKPGIESRSPTLQVDSLPAEPPGKSKNTGMGSPSFLQWIFPSQELNQGLLHCRQILYQLSCQGNPSVCIVYFYKMLFKIKKDEKIIKKDEKKEKRLTLLLLPTLTCLCETWMPRPTAALSTNTLRGAELDS